MKLSEDALLAIIGSFRKGLVESVDISDLLRNLDLVLDPVTNSIKLSPDQADIWSVKE